MTTTTIKNETLRILEMMVKIFASIGWDTRAEIVTRRSYEDVVKQDGAMIAKDLYGALGKLDND